MTTTIAIITGIADRRGPSQDGGVSYPLIPGQMASVDRIESGEAVLFDVMIGLTDGSIRLPRPEGDTADRSGVSWHTMTPVWVAGSAHNLATASSDRVAVIDLDSANGLDVLHVINWVNHIDGAELPG
jgi:hypothetical protein